MTPMMPPKNSPAYSPQSLDTVKKVKGQSQMYCECKNILQRSGEVKLKPCVLFLHSLSSETFIFWGLEISIRPLKISIPVFLSSFLLLFLTFIFPISVKVFLFKCFIFISTTTTHV